MAATFFHLPAQDVLFSRIFSYLGLLDIWRLRSVSTQLHSLCWDYFSNVCSRLIVTISSQQDSSPPPNMLGLGAGIAILKTSMKMQSLEIVSSLAGVEPSSGSYPGFRKLLGALLNSDGALKRLCFSSIDLSSAVPLLEGVSLKCQELKELELCSVVVEHVSMQWILAQLLRHSKQSLLKLSIKNLAFSPSQPLPVESFSGLRYFSVSI